MKSLKYNKLFCSLMLAVSLFGLYACSNEDTLGKDIPYAGFNMSALSVQTEDTVTFSNTTSGGNGSYTYAWNFGDGEFSTEANPIHSYAEKGIYTITLQVTDGNGKVNSYSKNIEVLQKVKKIGDLNLRWIASGYVGRVQSNTPALSRDGKSLYMTSNDQILHCYDATTGMETWSFDMVANSGDTAPSGGSYCTPSVDTDGTIYVTAGWRNNGKLFAVNPDGTKKWVTGSDANTGFWNKGLASNPGMRYGTPVFDDQRVYCGNGGATGSMVAFDKKTGNRVTYLTNAAGTAGPAGGITQGPYISADGMMYMIGTIYGMFGVRESLLNSDNIYTPFAWKKLNGADLKPYGNKVAGPCYASMAIDEDGNGIVMIYSGKLVPYVMCIDPNGKVKWGTEISNTGKQDQGGMVIGVDGTIYASLKATGEVPGGIVALDKKGNIKWRFEVSEGVSGSPAIDANGDILFGTESGVFYVISSDGQKVLSMVDIAGLIMLNKSATSSAWTPSRGKFWSSPIIGSDGTIYIGLTNLNGDSKSQVVALKSKYVTGPANSLWPMKGRDAQHTSRAVK